MNANTGGANLTRQQARMLDYMRGHKYVTRATALSKIGIANAPEIIRQLKSCGHVIDGEWVTKMNRYGERAKYKRWFLVREAE